MTNITPTDEIALRLHGLALEVKIGTDTYIVSGPTAGADSITHANGDDVTDMERRILLGNLYRQAVHSAATGIANDIAALAHLDGHHGRQ